MDIKLKNFRKHVSRQFSFPKKGFVLLEGFNGQGKSSLLNSIYYAFYGRVADSFPPYTRGTSTCKVEINYRGYKVTRTSRPNRLLVHTPDGTTYEDDAAQGVVDTLMKANASEFFYSSFVIQRGHNSVLSMSAANQLKFVEALAFCDSKHVEYAKRAKEIIKEKKMEIVKCEAEIGSLESSLREKEKSLNVSKKVTAPDGIEEDEKLLKDLTELADEKKAFLENNEAAERKRREKERQLIEVNKEIECLKKSLEEIEEKTQGEVPTEEDIEEIRLLVTNKRKYEKHDQERKTFEKLVLDHFRSLERKRDTLKARVFTQEEIDDLLRKKDDMVKLREKYVYATACNQALEKDQAVHKKRIQEITREFRARGAVIKSAKQLLHFLTSEKASLENAIHKLNKDTRDKELEAEVFTCPNCDTHVVFRNSALEEEETASPCSPIVLASSQELDDLHRDLTLIIERAKAVEMGVSCISKAGEEVPLFCAEDLEKLEETIQLERKKLEDFERLEKEIDEKILPQALRDLKKKVSIEETDPEPERSSDGILEDLHEKENALEEYVSLQKEKDELQKKIRDREVVRKKLSSTQEAKGDTHVSVTNEVSELRQRIIDLQTTISKKKEKISQAKAYENYLERKRSLEKTVKEIEEKKKSLGNLNRGLRGCLGFVEACKQAEVLAVEKTIQSINAASKVHIDAFFDTPTTVCLETVQKDSGKLSIKTVIDHDGVSYSDASELGGGNSQKCEIAFVLGVADMVGSRLLMLDECVNNTSTDVKVDMLNYIKEACSNKLVLVISHDSIEGVFDDIIKV